MEQGFLLPDTSEETTAPFWEGCARGELLVQACGACGRWRHPPRPMCPYCRSTDVTWDRTSGTGRVWSFVVPHPPLLPAYSPLAPYNVIVVELDDDPKIRFVGNLVASAEGAINELDPHSITVGEPVQVVFHQLDDVTLPRWVRR
jgi:uncharacterized OB-fold protein